MRLQITLNILFIAPRDEIVNELLWQINLVILDIIVQG